MKAIIIGDTHFPNQSDEAIGQFEDILTDLVAHDPQNELELILNGDILDCFDISQFLRVERGSLRREFDLAYEFLKEWRRIMGDRKITYIAGNHEHRLRRYVVSLAPEIYEFVPRINTILGLETLKIEWVDLPERMARFKDNYISWNGVLIGHFDRVQKFSCYTAKNLVQDKGQSIVQAHTHRAGMYFQTFPNRTLFGIEGGCLCKLETNYTVDANWQRAVTILTLKDGTVYPELKWIKS